MYTFNSPSDTSTYFHNVGGTGSYTTSTTNMYNKYRFHVLACFVREFVAKKGGVDTGRLLKKENQCYGYNGAKSQSNVSTKSFGTEKKKKKITCWTSAKEMLMARTVFRLYNSCSRLHKGATTSFNSVIKRVRACMVSVNCTCNASAR